MTKLIVAFRNFAHAPKIFQMEVVCLCLICISYLLYICVLTEIRFVASSFLSFYTLYIIFSFFM
jgi:hypothetical protein